mmetsp:Transcript_30088/g.45969  ORF Transcript_30088/g.45969 Transcript_30088/m.45969 type:complete len:238 (+) Transcript_30088:1363-2076(+)
MANNSGEVFSREPSSDPSVPHLWPMIEAVPTLNASTSVLERVDVRLPMDELMKFPFFRDITILFEFAWTSSRLPDFNDYFPKDELVYQTLVYNFIIWPRNNTIVPKIVANSSISVSGDGIEFDASSSYVAPGSLLEESSQDGKEVRYIWSCEVPFRGYCSSVSQKSNSPTLIIPFPVFESSNAQFDRKYLVSLEIQIRDTAEDKVLRTRSKSLSFSYQEIQRPKLKIKGPSSGLLVS